MAFPRFGQGAGTGGTGGRGGIFAAAASIRAKAGNTIRALASRGPTPGGGPAARFVPASPGKARAGGGKG